MRKIDTGAIFLALYALTAGVIGLFLDALRTLDVFAVIAVRGWIAVVFLLGFAGATGRVASLKPGDVLPTLGMGVFQGLAILFYFFAILRSSMSNAAFLLYTAPLFSTVMAIVFLKEKLHRTTPVAIVCALCGIVLILNPATFSFSSSQTMGNLAALGAGLMFAAMGIVSKAVMRNRSALYGAFWQYLVIAFLFSPFLVRISRAQILAHLAPLLGLGIICTGISFLFFMEGAKRVPGQKLFVLTSLEPLAAMLAGLLVLGQKPLWSTAVGAICIFAGIVAASRK